MGEELKQKDYDEDTVEDDLAEIELIAAQNEQAEEPATHLREVETALGVLWAAVKDSRLPQWRKGQCSRAMEAIRGALREQLCPACGRAWISAQAGEKCPFCLANERLTCIRAHESLNAERKTRELALENALQHIAGSTTDKRATEIAGTVLAGGAHTLAERVLGVEEQPRTLCPACGGTGYSLDAHEEACTACGGSRAAMSLGGCAT